MNNPVATSDDSLAEITVRRVREGLARSDTACVTEVLDVLQEMSQRADCLSIQDLAALIGRDLTTVTKVMKAAHCLGYNPAGVEVTTLAEAITVIGFDKVRNLVLSLLLIETAEARGGAVEAREVAALALTSALTAQTLATQAGSPHADQAFVCAALRQYGKLLLCTFLTEDYQNAMALVQEGSPETAFQTVFGLTTFELAHHILAEANLPKLISNSIQPVSPLLLQAANPSDGDRLLLISDFATRVCATIARTDLTAEQCQAALAQLVRGAMRSLALSEEDLLETLQTVDEVLSTFARVHGVSRFSSGLITRLRCLAEGKPWQVEPGARPRTRSSGTEFTTAAATAKGRDPLAEAIADVERLIRAGGSEPRSVFSAAARGIRAGLRLRSCLIFFPEASGPLFAPTIGSGPLFDALRNQAVLNPQHRDVFSVCLDRGEDAVIQDPSDAKIAPFIPDWFQRAVGTGPLVLLPVQDPLGVFAVICGVVGPGERVELSAPRLQQLRALRAHLAGLRSKLAPRRAA
jgi:HD-like signal output (HDOD) protein